jgi:Tfp pilus assembly protein PilE
MKKQRLGLTLIELVVVVGILAVLTMLIVPKLDGLRNNVNHAAAASSVSDSARYIQTWTAMKTTSYPDGWDSLTDGTTMWAPASTATKTKGLHSTFNGTSGKFMQAALTAADVDGLKAIGIETVYDVTAALASSKRPGDMFTTRRVLTGTPNGVFVNSGTAAGINIIDRIYRANQKVGDTPGTPGAIPGGRRLLALGLGPMNDMIGKLTVEAPAYANVDSSLIYNRNIALFEVGTGASKAIFRGFVASDGDLLDDLTTYMNRDVQ